ncbi:peptide synthetase [Frankia sp. Ag45/Mut15]|uniref:Peptide synthetase n=1 Tax=Frankia umida TaxID=573489 RepID=A0ABT0JVJ4_9ACTN|nr:peptide synthetase [Frankia umida]MCK9875563.1 peptide synthetase [Frankia umida]
MTADNTTTLPKPTTTAAPTDPAPAPTPPEAPQSPAQAAAAAPGASASAGASADLASQVIAAQQGADAHALVRAFAANPAFRAAEWEELTTEGNPYRRPVRPADLKWLNYAAPLRGEQLLKLSGLLGHRMLRNIYDADLLYLPAARNDAADHDAADFYHPDNRLRGALARPVLERHLFSFLEAQRSALPVTTLDAVRSQLHGYWEQRRDHPGDAFVVLRGTRDRREATTFALLQLSAYLPATRNATARAALGEYDLAQPSARALLLDDYRRWVGDGSAWAALLTSAGLTTTVGAYWQLYLNTSLARGNHLHHLSRAPERHAELLGAYVHQRIDDAAVAASWTDAVADAFGTRPTLFTPAEPASGSASASGVPVVTPAVLDDLVDTLLTPLVAAWGEGALTAFHTGFADAAHLARRHDRDLAEQLAWADAIDEHKARAEAISAYLTNERIEVDLDTFVETCDETSTTHVHDEHRLVMIESGDMHFWNNVTHKISLSDGDKILIPKSRLHGSTVLSGSCTYHQPIIPDDMYARF